jgi:hypothetical protein
MTTSSKQWVDSKLQAMSFGSLCSFWHNWSLYSSSRTFFIVLFQWQSSLLAQILLIITQIHRRYQLLFFLPVSTPPRSFTRICPVPLLFILYTTTLCTLISRPNCHHLWHSTFHFLRCVWFFWQYASSKGYNCLYLKLDVFKSSIFQSKQNWVFSHWSASLK